MAAIAPFRKPADKWTRLDPPPEAHYGLREGLERQQCPSVMFQLVSMEGYTTGELFFSVSPCSRGSTDSWCYKPIAQRAAEGSGVSSPVRELKLLLQAVVALCRTLACLTSSAVRNSLSSVRSEALTGRRTNCPFPCFCQHRLMASKLSQDSQDAGHLRYLASPLTVGGGRLLLGSEPQDGSVVLLQASSSVRKSFPFEWKVTWNTEKHKQSL